MAPGADPDYPGSTGATHTPTSRARGRRWLAVEQLGGHAGVDTVGQPLVALALGLDHRGGVDAGRGSKRVLAEHWVVRGDRHPGALGDDLAHLAQLAQIRVDPPEQSEVHEQ